MSSTATDEPVARGVVASLVRWADSWATDERDQQRDPREIDWLRVVPFIALHVDEKNKSARRAYEKVGFEDIGLYRLAMFPPVHG